MNAEPGDDLIVDTDSVGRPARVGTILEISGSDSHPEYLVHWVVGDYNSLICPWPGVHVRHRSHVGPVAGSHPSPVGTLASAGITGS
jgi:Domain of unknown function (DUF1918)